MGVLDRWAIEVERKLQRDGKNNGNLSVSKIKINITKIQSDGNK